MDRRRTVSSETVIRRRFRNFRAELNLFYTYSDWNITAAFILSFVTDLVALFLNLLEPLCAVCFGYMEALTLYNAIILYEFFLLVVLSYLIFRFLNLGLFQCQIMILWFHVFGVILFPFMISSMTSCFPDIQMARPLSYFYLYSLYPNENGANVPKQCPSEIKNCYGRYFNRLMTVIMLSSITGLWHTVVYGIRAWKRLSTIPTPHSAPAARPLMDVGDDNEQPFSPDEYDYRADESSVQSSDPQASTKSAKNRGKKAINPRRRLMYTSSSVSSRSTDSGGR